VIAGEHWRACVLLGPPLKIIGRSTWEYPAAVQLGTFLALSGSLRFLQEPLAYLKKLRGMRASILCRGR